MGLGRTSRTCTACQVNAPSTNTSHTLISRQGWRCVREFDEKRVRVAWFCPSCWARRKAKLGEGFLGRPGDAGSA